jgi:hypothetical protein
MAATFRSEGVQAEALDSTTPTEERRAMLARLRSGETQVLVNCAVLTEGFDEPGLECVIVARPTKSKVLYTQMIGRGTRIHDGKDDCLIVDLVGATERQDLMTCNSLFGLPIRERESVLEAEVRVRAEAEAAELAEAERAKLIAERVDLFRQRGRLRWAAAPEGDLFVLGLGPEHGSIHLVRRPESPSRPEADGGSVLNTWSAIHVSRNNGQSGYTVLGEQLSLEYAQGAAEDLAKRLGADRFAAAEAAWHEGPASQKQIDLLRRFGVPFDPATLTKGKASDALSLAFARKAQRQGYKPRPAWLQRRIEQQQKQKRAA